MLEDFSKREQLKCSEIVGEAWPTASGAAALAPSLRELLSKAKLRECHRLNGTPSGFHRAL